MNPLRAILVEDEPSGMENLRWKLEQNCPEIEIIAECTNGKEAIRAIKSHLPDVLFLDILLGDMSGFDVLKEIKHPTFELIFTTSYDEYAIQAIKNSALDYLIKPIDIDELMDAVAKARLKVRAAAPTPPPAPSRQALPTKIGVPIATGKQFIEVKDIIYAQADDNIAVLHMADGLATIKLTKPLNWVEQELTDMDFCRIHNSYIINLNQMKEYIRNDGGYVIMSDDKAISVSRRRKDSFTQSLEHWNGRK